MKRSLTGIVIDPTYFPGCVNNGIGYRNGATFTALNCDECVCILGEVICEPASCNTECYDPYQPPGECCPICEGMTYDLWPMTYDLSSLNQVSNKTATFLCNFRLREESQSRGTAKLLRSQARPSPGLAQPLPRPSPAFAQPLPSLCPAFAQPLPSLCPAFAQPLPSLCPAFAQPLPSLCPALCGPI